MLWILIVGLVAGFIARLLSPGPNKPGGFILTIVLGHRRRLPRHLHRPGRSAGIAPTRARASSPPRVGALVVLFIWNRLVARGTIGDPGAGPRV